VTERYAFSAFGVRTIYTPEFTPIVTSECAWEFAFHGQFLDEESGLIDYGYRYYSPFLGRWMSKDPIAEGGGLNLYRYSMNDSVNQVDFLGLATQPSFDCCDQECRNKGAAQLKTEAAAYNTNTGVGPFATCEKGKKGSCSQKNGGLLANLKPMPKCWECHLQHNDGYSYWQRFIHQTSNTDHWIVVCTPNDENGQPVLSEQLVFDATGGYTGDASSLARFNKNFPTYLGTSSGTGFYGCNTFPNGKPTVKLPVSGQPFGGDEIQTPGGLENED
jgi:RHS repeat-associated protein